MLSAKLFEDRIVLIDSEKLDYYKTKYLMEIMKPYESDRLTFLTPFDCDRNFELACRNLKNITIRNPQQLHVPDLVRSDLIFMTKKGLQQYEEILLSRTMNMYRNRKVPRTFELPSAKYLPVHIPRSRQNPDWENIVKPTLDLGDSLKDQELQILTPSLERMATRL